MALCNFFGFGEIYMLSKILETSIGLQRCVCVYIVFGTKNKGSGNSEWDATVLGLMVNRPNIGLHFFSPLNHIARGKSLPI